MICDPCTRNVHDGCKSGCECQHRARQHPLSKPGDPEPPPGADRIIMGGLPRCCLETLSEFYPNGPERKAAEGQRLRCKHARPESAHGFMVFQGGAWAFDVNPIESATLASLQARAAAPDDPALD